MHFDLDKRDRVALAVVGKTFGHVRIIALIVLGVSCSSPARQCRFGNISRVGGEAPSGV